MKKVNNYLYLILLVFLLISALSLVACEIFPTNKGCSHESTEWVIDKNPSCTEIGARHKICTLCNVTLASENIEKTKHVEELIAAVGATPLPRRLFYRLYEKRSVAVGWGAAVGSLFLLMLSTAAIISSSYNPFLYFRF